ncbi:membrane protein [Campylobacter sp. RM16704]|uniref:membrane protein n=1 Tax=Campylobacter sp. RM16704 TaxID=1500960 RepID=UPI00057CB98B|nr:membrane protein [Campylobacter sp. RM16704]AJC86723.1 PepSY-associated TM helix domain membrane protein [Campylobacter sp. RM16704]
MNKNKFFRQIHIYISLFFLPLAFLYALTGFAYIAGFDGESGAKIQNYKVQAVIQKGAEAEFLIDFLNKNSLKLPSSLEPKLNKKGNGIELGTISYTASIIKIDENNYEIITKERSLLGNMILLHKDKGMWYFSVLGLAFALAMIVLYISGLLITLIAIRKDRGKQIVVLGIGFVITLFIAYLSV